MNMELEYINNKEKLEISSIILILQSEHCLMQYTKCNESKNTDGDEAEDDDQGNVAPGVAGLADTKESIAVGTGVGELFEAR